MKIGIDLTPIQGPHRMRGIGYTLINFLNHLPERDRKAHSFVFYVLPAQEADFGDPLSILNLQGIDYEVRPIHARKRITRRLPGKLNLFISFLNTLIEIKDLKYGDSRIRDLKGVEAFLQTDQSQSFPHKRRIKKLLVVYDIIPYVLEWDYLWSYKTAREVRGYSRKAAFRCHVRRKLYIYKLGLNLRHANKLLAISEVTKQDFLRTFSIKEEKIVVTPLGVPPVTTLNPSGPVTLQRFTRTSWGYLPYRYELDQEIPFLLFVGGADRRRKLEDLVTAFNHLRAQGIELKLILAGDSMTGPEGIATEEIQGALKTSSYLDDIIFMGFIDDTVRDWLYKHALVFVFPSKYEGFGLPVLEAMSYGCPVISYKNEATIEVAANSPLYVNTALELSEAIQLLLHEPSKVEAMRKKGFSQIKNFDWEKTSSHIISEVVS